MNITNLLNIKHFLNTSSYFTNHLSKSLRVIINISIITSLVLVQSLVASNLPSGGKFINGTGSIVANGNTMNIAGDKIHNVIAWGGGFNIGKDNTVNFTTNSKNYLNLDYTNRASQILGTLNGGTNNVYIVNPSGVLVGEGATINANKFGVSTTPMSIDAINTFSVDGSFSPVFNTNKGDVVNMGTIKANEIVLVGNKVENIKGTLQADKVDIKGDKVYLEDFGIDSTYLKAEIGSEGFFKYEVKDVYDAYKDDSNLVDNYEFTGTATTNGNFKEYLYIGSQSASNEEMINSWKGFAKLVNEGIFGELKFKDVYLGKDIDFAGASTINPVGFGNGFSGNFYGNNHTLSNIQIDIADKTYVGLFGYIKGGSVQNLTIDGLQFPKYAFSYKYLGGLAGYIENGTFSNITLRDIKGENYSSNIVGAGGFAGYIENGTVSNIALDTIEGFNGENSSSGGFAGEINSGTFNNISLKNLGNIGVAKYAGGFAGQINGGDFSNIVLSNTIGTIQANKNSGGFAGQINGGDFSSINLSNIESIYGKNNGGGFVGYTTGNTTFDGISLKDIRFIKSGAFTGGFVGMTQGNVIFENIVLNDLEEISGSHAGGFVGGVLNNENGIASLSNIALNNIESIKGIGFIGGFAGWINDGTFSNIALNNIKNISDNNYAGGFAGWINDGTFNNIVLNNIEKISVSATHKYIFTGGFTGYAGAGTYKNIILNNIGEISANGTASLDEKSIYAGGFAGRIKSDGINFSNIVLNDIDKISASIAAGGFVGNIENGSNITNSNIYFYGEKPSASQNDSGIQYKETPLDLTKNDDLATLESKSKIFNLQYFEKQNTDGTIDSYLHMVTDGKIGDKNSNITFNKEKYTYANPSIKEVNLNPSLPTIPGEGQNSDVILDKSDFPVEILETIINDILKNEFILGLNDSSSFEAILSGMDLDNLTTENIQTILKALLGKVDEEDKVLESIRQSLDFYAEFNQGETDGLKRLFETWYKDTKDTYNISMDKHTYLIDKVKEIPSIIAEFKEVQKSIEDYNNKVDLSERELKEAISSYEALLEEYKKLLASYDVDDSEIKNVFDNLHKAFKDNLEAFNTQLTYYNTTLEDYNNGSVTYEDTLNAYKALTANYKALMNAHNSAKESAEAYRNKNNAIRGEYANLVNKINALNEAFDTIQDKNYDFTALSNELHAEKDALNLGNTTNYEGIHEGGFTFNGNFDGLLSATSSTTMPSESNKPLLADIDMPNDLNLGGFNLDFNVPFPEVPGNLPTSEDGLGEASSEIANTLTQQVKLTSKESILILPAEETQSHIKEDERERGRVCITSDNAKTNNPCIAITF